jgi:hypothetical protein
MRIMKEEANPIIIILIIIPITTPASLKPEEKKMKSDRGHMLVISNPKWKIFLPQILRKSCTNSSRSREQSREPLVPSVRGRAKIDRSTISIPTSIRCYIHLYIHYDIHNSSTVCMHPSIYVGVVRQSRNQISSIRPRHPLCRTFIREPGN